MNYCPQSEAGSAALSLKRKKGRGKRGPDDKGGCFFPPRFFFQFRPRHRRRKEEIEGAPCAVLSELNKGFFLFLSDLASTARRCRRQIVAGSPRPGEAEAATRAEKGLGIERLARSGGIRGSFSREKRAPFLPLASLSPSVSPRRCTGVRCWYERRTAEMETKREEEEQKLI